VALTGSDRKYVPRMSCFFPRFFLSIAVVQVPWLPEVTKGHVTPKDVEGCAHAHAYTLPPLQGLRDLRSLLVAMVLVLLI
jgi:hypothetical protein